jgi:hypothetical protein
MITRWNFLISALFLSSGVIPATAFGQESRRNQSGWRATVECDSLVAYSQMSTDSKVMGLASRNRLMLSVDTPLSRAIWVAVQRCGPT